MNWGNRLSGLHFEALDILKAKGESFRFELKGVSMGIREAGIGRRGSSSKDSRSSGKTIPVDQSPGQSPKATMGNLNPLSSLPRLLF